MSLKQRTLFGERLLDIAAEKVKEFVRRHQPHRLYVFFSAGKDSTAALAATVYAGPEVLKRAIVVYNELVGNTAPENVQQAYRILEKLGLENIVTVESPPYQRVTSAVVTREKERPFVLHIRAHSRLHEDFWAAVERWGIPVLRGGAAGGRRWCYQEFKEKHWRYLPPEVKQGQLVRFVVVGVKAADSVWRRARWLTRNPTASLWERSFTWKHGSTEITDIELSPILMFTTEQVWQLLEEAGLKSSLETYFVYGDSLNCIFCSFRSAEKQRMVVRMLAETEHGREMLRRVKEALERLTRAKPGTLSYEKAREWLAMIREALGEEGGEEHGA